MPTWVEVPVCGWDTSLCAVSRWNIATGQRWQRHQVINIGSTCSDGTQYLYNYHGAQAALTPPGMQAAMTPQQQLSRPGTPGSTLPHGPNPWDWRKSWMWAVKQVGYQVCWWGKVTNSWPCLEGDGYVFTDPVTGARLLDRYMLFLDDDALDNQTAGNPTGNNAYQTGQPYSGVDHTTHNESLYYATASTPFVFNNNLNNGGGSTLLTNTGAPGDVWNDATYLGTAGSAKRIAGAGSASAFLPDYYNRIVLRFLKATSAAPDNAGMWPQPPFVMMVCPRGSHNQWNIGQRHWNATPQNTPGRNLGTTQFATSAVSGTKPTWTSTLQWTNEPSLSNLSTANGMYVMLGCELMQIQSGYVGDGGAHTWTLLRDVQNDVENAMPQVATPPVWAAGTQVLQISSSTTVDTGDNGAFNENPLNDKSPWWRQLYGNGLTAANCVKARHDRIIKAKCGMAHDELYYDILSYCDQNFSNPTIPIWLSDNGWTYGEHACPSGKWKPYDLPGVGPLRCRWPDGGIGNGMQYPYFSQRPNIIVFLSDDDDQESLISGYPIFQQAVASSRIESNCVGWNGDVCATICDLAGATPYSAMDGISLAPYISGALTGKSPRTFAWLGGQADVSAGQPTFMGIYSINKRYWKWADYSIPSYAQTGGVTGTSGVPGVTYKGITEGYDHTLDPNENSNFIPNAAVNPGYTPPNQFSAADLATLEAAYQASLKSVVHPAWSVQAPP